MGSSEPQEMDYKETVTYLFNSTPVFEKIGAGAYKEGLYNTLALDSHLSHPHRHFMTIHVAGTNGKGSVSHTLSSILQSAGYRTGLFTSPHLVDFRERIRVNGQCVSEQYVIDFVAEHRAFFEPLHPSFFELTTAMAFDYFREQEVDVAVIEVGLGGRLDCTNIISPVLSIITNISLDHTQFLGTTLPQASSNPASPWSSARLSRRPVLFSLRKHRPKAHPSSSRKTSHASSRPHPLNQAEWTTRHPWAGSTDNLAVSTKSKTPTPSLLPLNNFAKLDCTSQPTM